MQPCHIINAWGRQVIRKDLRDLRKYWSSSHHPLHRCHINNAYTSHHHLTKELLDIDVVHQVRLAHGGSEAAAQKAVVAAGGNLSLWREHIVRNAESIWDTAACAAPQPLTPGSTQLKVPALFGFLWTGPCAWAFGGPTATTQTAALDVFVAAAGL